MIAVMDSDRDRDHAQPLDFLVALASTSTAHQRRPTRRGMFEGADSRGEFLATSKQHHTHRPCRGAQGTVKGRKWQRAPLCEFQIGGVVQSKPVAVSQDQGFPPGVNVGVLIRCDIEQGEVGKGGATEVRIDAAPADSNGQAVADL
jgi:hypothetical protein